MVESVPISRATRAGRRGAALTGFFHPDLKHHVVGPVSHDARSVLHQHGFPPAAVAVEERFTGQEDYLAGAAGARTAPPKIVGDKARRAANAWIVEAELFTAQG